MKHWTCEVEEDPQTGDAIIQLPPDLIELVGWKEGDVLNWTDNKDGSFTMAKKERTQLVLVEAVSTFRQRYMVEVPIGIDDYGRNKVEWALDTVTMEEAKEFSQKHLGEQIVSHRVISLDEAISLCDEENDYASNWSNDKKIETFFTKIDE